MGRPSSAIGIHEHNGGETGVHVPEDVAMEEPGASVGGLKAEGGTSSTSSGNVTLGRVDQVHDICAVGLDDPEVVTVEMDRVGIVIIVGREGYIDNLVSGKDEGIFSDIEVSGFVCASEDLNESGNDGREVRDVVDVPLSLAGGDFQNEGDIDISSLSGFGDVVNHRDEVSLNEFGCDGAGGDGSSGFSVVSTLIAKDTTRERDVEVRVGERVSTDVWQIDPVVANGLVGIEDNVVSLASKDINGFDGVGLNCDTIDANDGEVVVVDRHGEFTTDGLGDDTETVAETRLDRLNSEGNDGATVEATSTVHDTGISDGDETRGGVCCK